MNPGIKTVAAALSLSSLEGASGPLAIWRGQDLAHRSGRVLASGHATLDAELPGGGWPLDGMVELLQASPQGPFWQLVLPALAQAVAAGRGPVVLVAPPHAPFLPGLAAQGVPADRWLCVRANRPAPRVWATEQALRCADVTAVLAWLPQAREPELRRLQLLAQERERLLFVFRPAQAAQNGSPARLRLMLAPVASSSSPHPDALEVTLLKRRGPPLSHPLTVRLHAPVLEALLASRQGRVATPVQPEASPAFAPATARAHALRIVSNTLGRNPVPAMDRHALDRTPAA